MSAAAKAWSEEAAWPQEPANPLRPVTEPAPEDGLSAAGQGWNVLTETLVEFPRPAWRPFLDSDEAVPPGSVESGPGYGGIWLRHELAKLHERASDGGSVRTAADSAVAHRRREDPRTASPARSLRGSALAGALDLADDPAAELLSALDAFLSPRHTVPKPERRARAARAAAPTRTTAALVRPRGLRRLLPGAATLVVLAALIAGAASLAGGRAQPTTVIAGSVKLPSGQYAYIVKPGDTLWSIASRLQPGGDPRPLVAELQSQLHGGTLEPGERLLLP
ncbi:MAG: LysM peptidoglycan-binding domain-containing protein [Acidimicrobiales bacterium]